MMVYAHIDDLNDDEMEYLYDYAGLEKPFSEIIKFRTEDGIFPVEVKNLGQKQW